MLFDKNGILRLDELMAEQPTFQKIMEDKIVTDEEITGQARLVLDMLQKVEQTFSPEQMNEIENLLAEFGILSAIYQYKQLQDIHQQQ